MSPRLVTFALRRTLVAILLIAIVSSAAMLLARLAPGDHLSTFDVDPAAQAAERRRLGLDQPLMVQYLTWARSMARLDLGESTRYPGRQVSSLIRERAGNSLLLGTVALLVATAIGIPLGTMTGSRRGAGAHLTRAVSALFLATPPAVLSLALLTLALRTGWLPVGGLPRDGGAGSILRHLILPGLALALPIAATLERLQSRAMADALADPSIIAARARGVPQSRLVWRHAFRLSLKPVLGIYGIIVGSLISGSFVVEYVMTWPGLGRLMYDALLARDANLVAGCAATGAAFLTAGILAADIALATVDPRLGGAE